ncbi:CAP2 [[Candida] subhashii]|uniref:F-actin-capping protein subunit beta n=1 Tax=[Candida] subhashii TaxID=561895 RepID=A0A8J5QST0_9ASCO|nr:CAP2 [[Candida] subhashii]KAG7665415.1 CAP2 [[Candida] subhashii]
MSYEDKFDSSLDILRRLDPRSITTNLNNICTLVRDEELVQDLLSSVDTPLKVSRCQETGKEYLCCDYNRDGDSYRSPWSNTYYPKISTGDDDELPPFPSELLRQLEIKANDSFDIYRDLYYEGAGVSSVYLWDTAEDENSGLDEGFAGVVLFKKETDDKSGKWDSIHVFEVIPESKTSVLYKLTTSVILDLSNTKDSSLSLSGNLTRQLESTQVIELDGGVNLESNHLINLGTLIEKSEYNIRNLLQEVYFDKLKDIMLKDLRSIGDISDKKLDDLKQSEIVKGLQGM